MSMSFEYTVKVFADAIESGLSTISDVPKEYQKEVEAELWERKRKRSDI